MKIFISIVLWILMYQVAEGRAQEFSVTSPDKRSEVKIELGNKITYSLIYDGKLVIKPSPISLELFNGKIIGANPNLRSQKTRSTDTLIKTLYGKNAVIHESYNELALTFQDNFSVVFRAYNEGVAYHFITNYNDSLKIKNEEATFAFSGNYNGYYRKGKKQDYLYEAVYEYSEISKIDSGRVAILPLLVQIPNGPKIAITESDLTDYPGMYLLASGNTLKGAYRNYPAETNIDQKTWSVSVTKTKDYIAQTSGSRTFPWRIIMIANQDKELMNNELVYLLSPEPSKNFDFSWVKTGLIANDWWNLWWDQSPGSTGVQEVILSGVDFKSGTNFNTYKYFIEYALKNNIEFVNLDYGWCDPYDFSKVHPNLNLPELLAYSKAKNKRLFLWCIAKTLYKDLEKNMAMFETWGIAGLKVDFLERDDQVGEQDYHRIAESAARHHLLLEYHGATNPAGLTRTYPNLITFEAVYGSEQNMVGTKTDPQHNVTIPFIRGLAGPFDYAPGAMNSVSKSHFYPFNGFPMTLGTRVHQIAMFVIYYSPLQFMCDVPSNYNREPDCLDFIKKIPSTWDVTYPLDSRIGEYVAIARKKGDNWFAGAMTNWSARTLKIKCDFLEQGDFTVDIFKDGINADLNGNDYKTEQLKIKSGDQIAVDMASGGGWTARFTPVK
jgi:alpha-glucosidase